MFNEFVSIKHFENTDLLLQYGIHPPWQAKHTAKLGSAVVEIM